MPIIKITIMYIYRVFYPLQSVDLLQCAIPLIRETSWVTGRRGGGGMRFQGLITFGKISKFQTHEKTNVLGL